MTIVVAIVTLVLVVGILGAILKRLFKLAVTLAGIVLLVLGVAIFVIAKMH